MQNTNKRSEQVPASAEKKDNNWRSEREIFKKAMTVSKKIQKLEQDPTISASDQKRQIE